jgi:hypothetical protein
MLSDGADLLGLASVLEAPRMLGKWLSDTGKLGCPRWRQTVGDWRLWVGDGRFPKALPASPVQTALAKCLTRTSQPPNLA